MTTDLESSQSDGRSCRLRIDSARHPQRTVTFEDLIVVGRSAEVDVPLDDPFASRRHFSIQRRGDDVWLSDLNSRNGTVVNGMPVREPMIIVPGDRIRVGDTVIQLEPDGQDVTAGLPLAESPRANTNQLTTVLSSVERATGVPCPPEEERDLFKVVSEASVALLAPASLSEALSRTLDLVFDAVPAERALLYLRLEGDDEPTLAAANHRDREQVADDAADVRISRNVRAQVLDKGQSILTSDAQLDSRFNAHESVVLSGVRSILAVPLAIEERVLGMLYADTPAGQKPLTKEDLELATTIASVAAIKVENSMLVEERIESERLREQVAKAREIQQALLPACPPALPGYRLDGSSRPCWEVGGDCFDFIPFGFGRLLIVLGDVAGKGLDAALVISSLHAFLRSQAFEQVVPEIANPISALTSGTDCAEEDSDAEVSSSPAATDSDDEDPTDESPTTLELESGERPEGVGGLAAIVERLNHYLVRTTPSNRFATLFLGLIDARTHRLEYVNAGHNPPMVVSADGDVHELAATGMPVGMLPGGRWQLAERSIEPGDTLLAFSDGVTEAEDADGQELGEARLSRWLVKHRDRTPSVLRRHLLDDLDRYVGDRPPHDDVTLLIAQRATRGDRT